MTAATNIDPTELPDVIHDFLLAHRARDADTAIRSFTADAVVADEGRSFQGTDQVLEFLRSAGAEFTYTTELVGAERTDDEHWTALIRIEGDFPGGVADLTYQVTLDRGRISELQIVPTAAPDV
jgi:ketosteroid isomerase-like protein